MRTEAAIRTNEPVELFKVDGAPVMVKALKADHADAWMQYVLAVRVGAQNLHNRQMAFAASVPAIDTVCAPATNLADEMEAVRKEQCAQTTRILESIKAYFKYLSEEVPKGVDELSYGELLAVHEVLCELSDPFAVSVFWSMQRTIQVKDDILAAGRRPRSGS